MEQVLFHSWYGWRRPPREKKSMSLFKSTSFICILLIMETAASVLAEIPKPCSIEKYMNFGKTNWKRKSGKQGYIR